MSGFLPAAVAFAAHFNGYTRAQVPLSSTVAAIRGQDPQHLVLRTPLNTTQPSSMSPHSTALPLEEALDLLTITSDVAHVSLPRPGHPIGLAGPADFNMAAIDAGQAVFIGSVGLVPFTDARTVVWRTHPANPAAYLDPGETSQRLRQTLIDVADQLADLEVASWEPAIPDALLNRSQRATLSMPDCYSAKQVATMDQALLCIEIAELANDAESAALNAAEHERRRVLIDRLEVAAREALVAAVNTPG